MKVLLFNEYTSIYGGTDNVVDTEALNLIHSDVEIECYTIHNKNLINLNISKKIDLYCRSCLGESHIKPFQKIIYDFKPDIIHFHNIYQLFRAPIWNQIDPNGARIVLHLHNYYPFCLNSRMYRKSYCRKCFDKDSWLSGILHQCYKKSISYSFLVSLCRLTPQEWLKKTCKLARIIVVSKFLFNEFNQLGIPAQKLEVLPNSIRLNSKANRGNYLLFLGNVIVPKGIELFCEVAKRLPHLKFIVAGEGADSINMKNKYKLLSNLIFVGYLSDEKKYNVIKGCRFLYNPVQCNETFGITVLEAFSFGKPVLTTGFGAIQELVNHGFTGRINPDPDIISQVKSVQDFWNELNVDSSYSENCMELCKEYSVRRHINKLINIYKDILNEGE